MATKADSGDSRGHVEQAIEPALLAVVEARLGRPPRGLRAIAVRDDSGMPMVIRVASVVDDRPFPTLFWLIDPALSLRIDRAEASGLIRELQEEIDADPQLQSAMGDDHRRHIALRESFMSSADRQQLQQQGQWSAVAERGIGGIADFARIRCLHTWYAAHLVQPNTIGRLLDQRWAAMESEAPLRVEGRVAGDGMLTDSDREGP